MKSQFNRIYSEKKIKKYTLFKLNCSFFYVTFSPLSDFWIEHLSKLKRHLFWLSQDIWGGAQYKPSFIFPLGIKKGIHTSSSTCQRIQEKDKI